MSIPHIKKYDSGFSETATTLSSSSIEPLDTILEQILLFEKNYYENLKQYIIKYSRPLRRYLNSDEIVDLFQNIEKISAISESIIRQGEKLLDSDNISISMIYQSWSGVMIDSYNSYLSRSIQAQNALKQYENKIAYFLQFPIDYIVREITAFILLPIQHVCLLNEFFQSIITEYSPSTNNIDWKIIEDVRLLARQANVILQSSCHNQHDNTVLTLESSIYCAPNVTLETSQDTTLQSEILQTIVLHRTNKEPWEPKQLELSDLRLKLTQIDRTTISSSSSSSMTTSLCLANVVHIQEDCLNKELRLIVARTIKKSSKSASLTNAVQQAKDQSWTKKNELVI